MTDYKSYARRHDSPRCRLDIFMRQRSARLTLLAVTLMLSAFAVLTAPIWWPVARGICG